MSADITALGLLTLCVTAPHCRSNRIVTPNPAPRRNPTGSCGRGASRSRHNRARCVTLSCVVGCVHIQSLGDAIGSSS